MTIEDKKRFSEKWFEYLQDQICDSYESIEKKFGGLKWKIIQLLLATGR